LNTRPLFLVPSLLAVALAWSAALPCQVVTGQVIDSTSGMPAGTGVSLSGTVLDSVTMQPLADVAVHLDRVSNETRTDSAGSFRLSDLGSGEHVLVFLKQGFSPRTYQFEVTGVDRGNIDVGLVGLARGPAPVAEMSGTVSNAITNEPVVGAMVSVNGRNLGVTGPEGTFWFRVFPHLGTNRLTLRRIGYGPVGAAVWIARDSAQLDLDVKLYPVPVQLEEVVVEGERTIYDFGVRLRGFNRRRQTGLGKYFTREDIERRQPQNVSDLLARAPSVFVTPNVSGHNVVRMRGPWGPCQPAVFIDGVKLSELRFAIGRGMPRLPGGISPLEEGEVAPVMVWEMGIDDVVMPDEIAGIEVYRGPAETPAELGLVEGDCGVIAIWTRSR
jgi:hypothetical protein